VIQAARAFHKCEQAISSDVTTPPKATQGAGLQVPHGVGAACHMIVSRHDHLWIRAMSVVVMVHCVVYVLGRLLLAYLCSPLGNASGLTVWAHAMAQERGSTGIAVVTFLGSLRNGGSWVTYVGVGPAVDAVRTVGLVTAMALLSALACTNSSLAHVCAVLVAAMLAAVMMSQSRGLGVVGRIAGTAVRYTLGFVAVFFVLGGLDIRESLETAVCSARPLNLAALSGCVLPFWILLT
jgi:hypothetical protein